ncbi:MAG: hypothetical protein J6Y03_05100 [Alphaproteobacteria bacterium]|nr:hypothetical protein [Alphaproteobacteria bacterium]
MKKKKEIIFTILTRKQLWGLSALNVFKNYDVRVAATTLVTLLSGGRTEDGHYRTRDGEPACCTWTATGGSYGQVRCSGADASMYNECPDSRTPAVRPVIANPNVILSDIKWKKQGNIFIAEYGEYPQMAADVQTSSKLEELFVSKTLKTTGKSYTFDSTGLKDYTVGFQPMEYQEYEYEGKKYIRFLKCLNNENIKSSSSRKVRCVTPCWIQVQPIEWLLDVSGILISKKALISGLQFDVNEEYNGNLNGTSLMRYINKYFRRDIQPSQTNERQIIVSHNASCAMKRVAEEAKVKSK